MTPAIESPSRFSPKHRSGIDVIDDTWGGLYRGGSYLVYGQAMSGRGLLALMIAQSGTQEDEKTLFISSDRKKDVFIQAASIGFDLPAAHDAGNIRLIRVPTLAEIRYESDDHVSDALSDLIDVIVRQKPSRVIMMDFIPFIAFRSYKRFQHEFIRFLERIDALDTTVVLVMPEPANVQSRSVISFMALQMTGSIHIELAEGDPNSTRRCITLLPHVGHIRHRVVDYWDLEDVVEDFKAPTPSRSSSMAPSWDPTDFTPESPPVPYVEPEPSSRPPATPESQSAEIRPDAAPIQPSVPSAREIPVPDVTPSPTPVRADDADYMDRDAFVSRLNSVFKRRDVSDEPFLLLALKMDRSADKAIRPFDFDFLMDLVVDALRPTDDLFIDTEGERLVARLSNRLPADAKDFFAGLKQNLKEETPLQANHLLHNVLAIVVPNGRPFLTVDEFMNYALGEG